MDYIKCNKEAWEEAYEHRKEGWGDNIVDYIRNKEYPFLEKVLVDELKKYDLKDKNIAQFCCNNGRELLSLMKSGAKSGTGFDIAANKIYL
jgi:uncharacterized protein YhfF